MSPNFRTQKVQRKVTRCLAVIEQQCQLKSSISPTNIIAVLNAGLSTGLTEEAVLEATTAHGQVSELVMLPNKSYCFMKCSSLEDAQCIYNALHNRAHLGQDAAVIYLAYFDDAPRNTISGWHKPAPAGLILIKDFVNAQEEQVLLEAVGVNCLQTSSDITDTEKQLKHRRVRHFGYEFLYGSNNVNTAQPLLQGIPAACDMLWPRVKEQLDFDWDVPDQLTVNEYEPGQGIPPHVDTHSAFFSPILALSLEAEIVMEFRRRDERISILLPRRSLLIMSGESRYDWTHGITPKIMDVVPTKNGNLTTQLRAKRTSLTFRRLRRGDCNCIYPTLCDTRLHQQAITELGQVAERLELNNVHKVYDKISAHFSETRHTPWPQVAQFIDSFVLGAVVLDVGCGNGKYLRCNKNILMFGCDRSQGLLQVCAQNTANVFRCDCLQLPVLENSVDGAISIAVIHHLATAERRLTALREMARVLCIGGRALVYVWAKDQRSNNRKSSYLLQNKAVNKQKVTEDLQRQKTAECQQQAAVELPVSLPIHTNRTEFQQQDVYVPWKLKNKAQEQNSSEPTLLRYYHVFEEGELESLINQITEVQILHSYYDQGNHCVIFQKKF